MPPVMLPVDLNEILEFPSLDLAMDRMNLLLFMMFDLDKIEAKVPIIVDIILFLALMITNPLPQ
jgi:hypothetical protein